ncbi:hypothetical protein, partial [Candidatus Enterovibrio escicola]
VARNDWQREQDCEVLERLDRQVEEWNEENESFDLNDIPHVFGLASKTSTLDGIKITYTEGFNYDECYSDSLSTGTEGQDAIWSVESVTVVDEDCDELNAHELADYLDSDFSSINYSVLEIEQIIDVDEDSDMETFTLDIDTAPNVRFTGELVANAASSNNQAIGSGYNGQTGRWTELSLYKTKAENLSVIKLVALEGKMSVTVLAARSVKRWKRLKSFLAIAGYPKSCTLRLALMM